MAELAIPQDWTVSIDILMVVCDKCNLHGISKYLSDLSNLYMKPMLLCILVPPKIFRT